MEISNLKEKNRASPCGTTIPPKNILKLKYGYDDSFFISFDNDTEASEKFIAEVICHSQTHYCHESLGAEIQLEVNAKPRKDHFKNDLRSDQDHLLKNDLRSDQDHIFSKK
jgi:hypothetical protein